MRPRYIVALLTILCTSHRNAGAWSTGTSGFLPGSSAQSGGPTGSRDAIDIIDDAPLYEVETSVARRRLLLSTMAITVATVSMDDLVNAVEMIGGDDTEQPDVVPATPSVVEGELAVSQPPPYRSVSIADERPDRKKNVNRSGYFVAGGASGS